MSAAPSLYEKIRALVEEEASGLSLARARVETRQGSSPSYSIPIPDENPQVTTSTPCPHVTDPDLAEWYAEHPQVVCARCWLERKGRPIREAP
jgi:hypothetical protein